MKIDAIAASMFLVFSAMGLGSLLLPLIPRTYTLFDKVALIVPGGLGILGTILFCLGQVLFSRSSIVLVLFLGALLSLCRVPVLARAFRPTLAKVFPSVLPAGIVLLVLLLTAVGGLAFPTGDMNNDAIAYHYHGPKVWLRDGVIRPVQDEVLTYFPVVVEAQYAALMSIGGQRAPGFFSVISLGSLLLATASLALRVGLDPIGAWWAVALVATMPAVIGGAYGGCVDALFASFILSAARFAFDSHPPEQFAMFGIFCGIAMGTKYTGIVAWGLLVCCSLLVSLGSGRRNIEIAVRWLAASGLIAILVASPFYLRNWILYGCPIYPPPPVLLKFFGSTKLLPAVMQELLRNVRYTGQGMGGGIVNFLLLPFHLTYHTADFRGAGGIGLAPLALGPFGMIARRRDPFSRGVLLFAVLQIGAWFITAQVSRYVIHIYAIGAIFAVLGWKYATDCASQNGRVLSQVVIAISVLYGFWMIASSRAEDVHAAVSPRFEARRRTQETMFAASFDYINNEASVKKVLILNPGVAAFFVDKPYVKPFGRWGEQTIGAANVGEVLLLLPALRATHVLDVEDIDGNFALPDHPPHLSLVFENVNQRIYRID